MSTMLKHRGYYGTIQPDIESGTLFGKLAFIRDLVTYEADDLKTLEKEFQISVDDYLKDCADLGRAPDTPCKGSFNVRVGHNLHLAATVAATQQSITLNDLTRRALSEYLEHRA
ncbi:Predicted nuclease of the RNAse H fold, HicB family [Halopseudomonas litoralis]|uniref:Predicted nuclease of the RNAse H fold, HicB family n=1 Tax=Halopseudomonas litoralis TaxID=797277 RepID=A0A1H1QNZ4_9GAMM|nr:type II toxin-antitoxin system HicB family antitoxin [Halopseudomonas litoralis]SDS25154.1 Predicted nuclease of the RNAse H fold, HicB family [Halopseudomonas litoralis]